MQNGVKFLLIIFIFLISINFVSANEINSNDSHTNKHESNENINIKYSTISDNIIKDKKTDKIKTNHAKTNNLNNNSISNKSYSINEPYIIKDNVTISLKSKNLKSRDSLVFYLKNSKNVPLINKILNIKLDNKNYTISTNSKGSANLKLTLAPKNYKIKIQFLGDDNLNPKSQNTKIHVSKLDTKIISYTNFVVQKKYLYLYLLGKDNIGISGKLQLKLNKKKFIKTANKNGKVRIKIKLKPGKYSIKINFKGNKYFNPTAKKLNFHVSKKFTFKIANHKLVKNGYIRVYLKGNKQDIAKKRLLIRIGNNETYKKTNSEGIATLKVNLSAKKYTIFVKCGKYFLKKVVNCINDTLKDPNKNNISLINGVPDLDYMPGKYVMADDNAVYTLTRNQYKEVIEKDSYCLFLNNKLSKYVCFKTLQQPNTYHILKREKWNVIEKEINKKIVNANKYDYWPSKIKVSLKGKSCKYSEVRDIQNTGYTCGPAAASMCSQVLRNYVNEKHLAKLAGTNKSGTKIQKLENALNKHNFTCTHFYRDSFDYALEELKKGGCGVIFHSQSHYVSILDISSDGKKVLVSNSYGTYNNIPSKWLSVSYMNTKFGFWDDSLVVRLNYNLTESKQNTINCLYNSMGPRWNR